MRLWGLVFAIVTALALPVLAQPTTDEDDVPPAVLIADEVFVTNDRELVARGNVEAFQGDVRLQAEEIRYSRKTGALTITGPIRMQDGEDITVLASQADLDQRLKTGLLIGARVVIDQQLQLTAGQVERVDDRYNQLFKTAVTSCDICDDGKPPLWQIRARRVIHDKEERQLYFEGAQFRIRNVPVAYLPYLRLPDPTVERATGFLIPSLRNTTELGLGVLIPYFIVIDDHRDITVTPYVSPKTRTVELRYRQAFVNGTIQLDGAVSRDDLRPGDTRGYIFGSGRFSLKNDYTLSFDVRATSDNAYLEEYNISESDRLVSRLRVTRAKRDNFTGGALVSYQSLRDDESLETTVSLVGDLFYQQRYFPTGLGGEVRLTANAHSHIRPSDDDVVGRDVARINTDARWVDGYILPGGVRMETQVGVFGDIFNYQNDSTTSPETQFQLTPFTTLALRYPMRKTDASGATQFLEPIGQLALTGAPQPDIPDEESTLVDFDDGNLLALSRFPAPDRRERGVVGAFGVNWSRFAPTGAEHSLTVGQVFRNKADESFTVSSGLSGRSSDYLVAGQIKTLNGFAVTARTLFDGSFDFTKAEIRGDYRHRRGKIGGSYLWLVADEFEDREFNTSELFLDASLDISDAWRANADWRYDFQAGQATRSGIKLRYQNECVEVDFSVRRRNTSSSSLSPSTTYGLTIGLRGFSLRGGSQNKSSSCG